MNIYKFNYLKAIFIANCQWELRNNDVSIILTYMLLLQCFHHTCRPYHRRRISQDHHSCWSRQENSSTRTRRARGSTAQRPDIRRRTSGGWRLMGRPCRTCSFSGRTCPTAHWPCSLSRQLCTDRTCIALYTVAWPPTTWVPSLVATYTSEPVSTGFRKCKIKRKRRYNM